MMTLKFAAVLKSSETVWLLDKHTWRSTISLDTKIRFYRAYVFPVCFMVRRPGARFSKNLRKNPKICV